MKLTDFVPSGCSRSVLLCCCCGVAVVLLSIGVAYYIRNRTESLSTAFIQKSRLCKASDIVARYFTPMTRSNFRFVEAALNSMEEFVELKLKNDPIVAEMDKFVAEVDKLMTIGLQGIDRTYLLSFLATVKKCGHANITKDPTATNEELKAAVLDCVYAADPGWSDKVYNILHKMHNNLSQSTNVVARNIVAGRPFEPKSTFDRMFPRQDNRVETMNAYDAASTAGYTPIGALYPASSGVNTRTEGHDDKLMLEEQEREARDKRLEIHVASMLGPV